MGTLPPVVHSTARAITPREFLDALHATCNPRFPYDRGRSHKPIALAISGGVDSMALAYLSTKIRATDRWFKVADHPVSSPIAYVVNHELRQGMAQEIKQVVKALRDLKIFATVAKINWEQILGPGVDPNTMPNIESLARQQRYQKLGALCRSFRTMSLFTAHHEDDQYETVLMRLLSGHGYRGLRGMRPANDIPECYDMHGVYQSGFVDDQKSKRPFWTLYPNRTERHKILRALRDDFYFDLAVFAEKAEPMMWRTDLRDAFSSDQDYDEWIARSNKPAPTLPTMDFEDGGVMVYRPLMHFDKDRLIATCLENNVPWFEDHTNKDPTMTMRNAVRHMWKNHKLPEALQKPAILRLAERCRKRLAFEEAAADRLLQNALIPHFEPSTGTLVVQLPKFRLPRVSRLSSKSPEGRQRRLDHYRYIAALLLRKLISMVTPERELNQAAQLDHLASMLFPSLAKDGTKPPPPKPYVICGVHFLPMMGPNNQPFRWLLTRAPYVSNVPRPCTAFYGLSVKARWGKNPSQWKTNGWSPFKLYDGRYWIRLISRTASTLYVMPFEVEHQKPFKEALDEQSRNDLAAMLKRYAPGKIRYTLPGIYSKVNLTGIMRGDVYWPETEELDKYGPLRKKNAEGKWVDQEEGDKGYEEYSNNGGEPPGVGEGELLHSSASRRARVMQARAWEEEMRKKSEENPPQLLALPTLGIQLPGLEDWLRWEVRFRKVDPDVLHTVKRRKYMPRRGKVRGQIRMSYRHMLLTGLMKPRYSRLRRCREISKSKSNKN
ncbi:hypothetical protein QBC40DRAFT_272376 [Triangularia verruculosa]|uniref:tRNA(Ile)-lysidine synthetase n=1 Tax=Triangularia verruculosa TaxID=2587418 RepID=A0AAN7B003_9PEZI|nr:hypothetical protein QBC40DRAFT_272376 [Triangularia verruculosa]